MVPRDRPADRRARAVRARRARCCPATAATRRWRASAAAPPRSRYAPGIALAAIGDARVRRRARPGGAADRARLGGRRRAGELGRADETSETVLGEAGSFAAISALFDGPLVAGMLLVEGGLAMGASLLAALLPGLVAAALGYVLFIGLGDWGGLDAGVAERAGPAVLRGHPCARPRARGRRRRRRRGRDLRDPAAGHAHRGREALPDAGAAARRRRGHRAAGRDRRRARRRSQGRAVLRPGRGPDLVTQGSAGIVLVLLAAKGLGYAVCLGCGFRGGPVFPAVFLGVAIAMLPVIAFDVSPTWAVAVGTAGGMAAGTRLLFAPILLGALLVGHVGLDAIPAAVLASAAAWLTVSTLDSRWGGHKR